MVNAEEQNHAKEEIPLVFEFESKTFCEDLRSTIQSIPPEAFKGNSSGEVAIRIAAELLPLIQKNLFQLGKSND